MIKYRNIIVGNVMLKCLKRTNYGDTDDKNRLTFMHVEIWNITFLLRKLR